MGGIPWSYFRHLPRSNSGALLRPLLAAFVALTVAAAGAWTPSGVWAQSAALSPYSKANRRDAIFLRFPEMAQRFWVDTETMAASHKAAAWPLPKQGAFVYADTYTRRQMTEPEAQATAVSNCNDHLPPLAPHGAT